MSELTAGSYDQHYACEVGQTVIATLDDGTTVSGTVVRCAGATVYVASDSGGMLEFRRIRDSRTGEKAILLGFDGKDVHDEGVETGMNQDGLPVTKESSTLSFDHQVVDFEAETQEVVLGDDSKSE